MNETEEEWDQEKMHQKFVMENKRNTLNLPMEAFCQQRGHKANNGNKQESSR